MDGIQIVVIGASAGGIAALNTLVSGLPADFSVPVCVVVHIAPSSPGMLPQILERAGVLAAKHAYSGERLRPGVIYVAPPDRHLLIDRDGAAQLSTGPKENLFRPAVDPLFRSAAAVYGSRAAGVILSGGLDDGTAGLGAIKASGGVAMVQDPNQAVVPSMPRSALKNVQVDECLPAEQIAARLVALTKLPLQPRSRPMDPKLDIENRIASGEDALAAGVRRLGQPAILTCPECHGTLLQVDDSVVRYRCHTGHAYSSETLAAAMRHSTDNALWSALRVLQERQELLQIMAADRRTRGDFPAADGLLAESRDLDRSAELLRRISTQPRVVHPQESSDTLQQAESMATQLGQ